MATNYIGGGVATPTVDSGIPSNTVTEVPPPIQQLQPPASNSGTDDPTGGIAKDAGGLSSTAHIGSPVTSEHEQQTVVGSVLEYAFGKKEREAVSVDAANPTSSTVTTSTQASSSSGTYLGAIAGAGAAAGAAVASIIPGMASTTGTETTAPSSVGATSSSEATGASETGGYGSQWVADTTDRSATTATEGTTGSTTTGTSQDKTLGEKASETAESAKATAAETAESAKATASETAEKAKESVSGEKSGESGEEHKPKQVSDHEAAIRENKDAIPTAGGEKLGAAHEGESKIIPDNPKPADVEGSAGKPDSTTAANTERNSGGPSKNRAELTGQSPEEAGSDKPKLMDRLKHKLHLDKKDKA